MNNIKKELKSGLERVFSNLRTREINEQRLLQTDIEIVIKKPELIEEFIDYCAQSFHNDEILTDICEGNMIEFMYQYYYASRFDTSSLEERFLPIIAKNEKMYLNAMNYCLNTHTEFERDFEVNKVIIKEKLKGIFVRLLEAGTQSGILKQIPSDRFITSNIEYKNILKNNNEFKIEDNFSLNKLVKLISASYGSRNQTLRFELTSYIIHHIESFTNEFKTLKDFDDWCDKNVSMKDKDGKKIVMTSGLEIFDEIINLKGQNSDVSQKKMVKSWLSDKQLFNSIIETVGSYPNLIKYFQSEFIDQLKSLPAEDKKLMVENIKSSDLDFSKNYNNFFKEFFNVITKNEYGIDQLSTTFNLLISFKEFIPGNDTDTKIFFSSLLHMCAGKLETVYKRAQLYSGMTDITSGMLDLFDQRDAKLSIKEFNDNYLFKLLNNNLDIYSDFLSLPLHDTDLAKTARNNLDLLAINSKDKSVIDFIDKDLKNRLDFYFTENHKNKNMDSGHRLYGYSGFLKKYYNLAINMKDVESFNRVNLLGQQYTKCIVKSVTGVKKDKKTYISTFPVFFELIRVAEGTDNLKNLINRDNVDLLRNDVKLDKKNFIQYFSKDPIIENILKNLIDDNFLFKKLIFEDKKVNVLLKEKESLSELMNYGNMNATISDEKTSMSIKKKI